MGLPLLTFVGFSCRGEQVNFEHLQQAIDGGEARAGPLGQRLVQIVPRHPSDLGDLGDLGECLFPLKGKGVE